MYDFAVGCKTSRVEWERQVAEYCVDRADEAARIEEMHLRGAAKAADAEEMWAEAAERAYRFANKFTE